MKHFKSVVSAILLILSSGLCFGVDLTPKEESVSDGTIGSAYVPGEVLVKWASGIQTESVTSVLTQLGGTRIQRFGAIGVDHVKLPEEKTVETAIAELSADGRVAYAEPNYYRRLETAPNDSYFYLQYGLHNSGQSVNGVAGAVDADIDAPDAWDFTIGSTGIVVAVLDSGVDWSHGDLSANIWINASEGTSEDGLDNDGNGYVDDIIGWDFRYDDNYPSDLNGHGTHVAGIIGASGNNGVGTTGVCWRVSLMVLKITDPDGVATDSDTIRALYYAYTKQARVINLSLGGAEYSQAYKDAIDLNSQAVVACAAGNEGSNNDAVGHYPSNYPCAHIIAVAASNAVDDLASFSNRGAGTVDLAAPGANILSTIPAGYYGYLNGTSMAAPMVSGTAALILSVASLSPTQVVSTLLSTVDPKPNYAGLMTSGGRLNAYRAVAAAASTGTDDDDDDDGGGGGCFISATRWR